MNMNNKILRTKEAKSKAYVSVENASTGHISSSKFSLHVPVIKYLRPIVLSRNDHTTMTASLHVCAAKLSIVRPG
jgi:hypothetical protein